MVRSTWVLSKCNCVLGCIARARKFRVIFCCEVLLSVIVYGTALQCLRIPLSVTKTGDKLHSWRGAPHPADIATSSTADSACYLPISCHPCKRCLAPGRRYDCIIFGHATTSRLSLLFQPSLTFVNSSNQPRPPCRRYQTGCSLTITSNRLTY